MEFNNTQIAFSHKSDYELKRAYYLFKLLSLGSISKIGRKALKLLVKLNFPIDSLILKTIYAQFCGGRDIFECEEVILNLKKMGYIQYWIIQLKDQSVRLILKFQ